MSCSVFIATSLDGFIARPDGSLDWLNQANTLIPAGEDCGFAAFMSTVDALVMGRQTFEPVCAFPAWPYGSTPVVVLSRRLAALPPGVPATVSLLSGSPQTVVDTLAARKLHRLYIDGGQVIQSFLQAGLIDTLIITQIPVLLGSGRPLFGPLQQDIHLDCLGSTHYPFGFVQSRYRVRPATTQ